MAANGARKGNLLSPLQVNTMGQQAANTMQAAPPASSGTQTKHSLVDSAVYDKISTEEDKKPLTIKLRKPGVKQTKPGNWKESEVLGTYTMAAPPTALYRPRPGKLTALPSSRPQPQKAVLTTP